MLKMSVLSSCHLQSNFLKNNLLGDLCQHLGMAWSDYLTGYMNSGAFISKEHTKLAIKMHRYIINE